MKISIVTPAYNMERWIAETIESVISQEGDFTIEYIVIDDGSKDRTATIAREYEKKISSKQYPIKCKGVTFQYHLQQNGGAIVAMNNGFSKASGDIATWVDADNTFDPGAFQAMKKVFTAYPGTQWVKGITSTIGEKSELLRAGNCKLYRQDWLSLGIYGQEAYFVEADSVFFTMDLWKKSGPIPSHYRSAGDYWLWIEMAKHSPLLSLNKHISNFRKREGQLSKGISRYKGEQNNARPVRSAKAWKARLFFSPQSRITKIFPKLEPAFVALYPLFFGRPNEQYVESADGKLTMKQFKSYKIL
ncbi:MAG TPA: glycosyltransferase [Candidatus Paceibacterota bacterium]